MKLRHSRVALLLAVLAPGFACRQTDDKPPPVEVVGSLASVRIAFEPFSLTILDALGAPVLRTLEGGASDAYGGPAATRDDGIDNVKVIPGWDAFVPDDKPWAHPARAKLIARSDTGASIELTTEQGSIAIEVQLDGAKVTIRTSSRGGSPAWNKTSLAFALRPDEHFFGLGERYGSVDHRGRSLYSWSEEGGLGGGEGKPADDVTPYPNGASMTYFPVPFFLSSAGYAVHLATTYRTETHFGSERPDAWRIAVNDVSLETVVYVHADPLASLDDFTRDTGRSFVPATWVFGPRRRVSSGQMQDGVAEYKLLRQKKVPTTGVDDAVHLLPGRAEVGREPELRQWIADAHAAGYKVMAYNNPYVSTSIAAAAGDLAYGKDHGLFALTADGAVGETFFISGQPQTLATIDLTKPEGVIWFQDLLRRSLALGYDGWMHDFGEYVRRGWRFGDGRNGEAVHNAFPVLSAKAAHDLMVAERPDDFLFFVRSGYTGTQKYVPAVWGGDGESTFDDTQGMPAMLRGGLNLGLSGVPLWGSDISGFKCLTDFPRDKEVYLRWVEMGAVSPIMMEQNACSNPIGAPREKWKLWNDQETIDVYGAMARLHTRLAPYFEVLARESHATGAPIMRHPFLHHPREAEAWAADSSFYLGASLFASPVVARGVTAKDTWLPPGKWVDLADLAVYDGGRRVSIPAPLAKLPLLLKDGGIVPMLDASIETLAPATDPTVVTPASVADRLDVMVALSAGAEARITLADGTALVARRSRDSNVHAASGYVPVTAEDVAVCKGLGATQGCVVAADEGMVSRLRITTPLAAVAAVAHDDVELSATGTSARRVRWDVLRLH